MSPRSTLLDSVPGDLQRHISSLELLSVSSYRLWCRRHGLPTSLDKTPVDLEAELARFRAEREPADPRVDPKHRPERAEWIRRIASGETTGKSLPDPMGRVRPLFDAVSAVPGAHEALLRILLHVEKHARLLTTKTGVASAGRTPANTILSGLTQLACHHADWLRPVETWFPVGRNARLQFRALSRHLFARYDLPNCLDAVWFVGGSPEIRTQQEWFKHVGSGGNIRTAAGLPFRLTRRGAHIFSQNGHRVMPSFALRIAQAEALGAGWLLAWRMTCHECMRRRENADFWTSIIHFFLNNPLLEHGYFEPIIDYIHHQKFVSRRVPQPDGTVRTLPPAHPGFSIKGRSATRLIREVDDWHAQLTGEEGYTDVQTWPASPFGGFICEERLEELNVRVTWSIRELCTSALLDVEGRQMHHCVASYARRCVTGETSIWSIRVRPHALTSEGEPEEERPVLTVAVDNRKRAVTQARGRYNLQPHGRATRAGQRRADRPYLILLRESARILALWRAREGLAYNQD